MGYNTESTGRKERKVARGLKLGHNSTDSIFYEQEGTVMTIDP